MRDINQIFLHCSATTATMDIGVKEIREWHLQRGFNDVGYHYVIRRDGTIEKGRPDDKVGAHTQGYNQHSIGICVVGGITKKGAPENNFNDVQFETLGKLVGELLQKYPNATIHGHCEVANKACPVFDVAEFCKKYGFEYQKLTN